MIISQLVGTFMRNAPWQCNDHWCGLTLKRQRPVRKSLGKSNPLALRNAQSGGNARPRESSPLRGVGGVSGLGPGYGCVACVLLKTQT